MLSIHESECFLFIIEYFCVMSHEMKFDHTGLSSSTTLADVEKLCSEAVTHGFETVSIPPLFVRKAKELTASGHIQVATVIGFPYGYNVIESKLAEIVMAMVDGADELKMVINMLALKNNDWQYLAKEITTVLPVVRAKGKKLTVILEVDELTEEEIKQCCDLYGVAGIDFLQAGTGVLLDPVRVESIALIRRHLADPVRIKATGQYDGYADAMKIMEAGASYICSSKCVQIVKQSRPGTSGMVFEIPNSNTN